MDAGVTLGKHDLGPDFLSFSEPTAGHGDGGFGKSAPDASPGTATERLDMVMVHLNEVWSDLPDGFSGFLVDSAVPSQIAWVMIRHALVCRHARVEVLQELADVNDSNPFIPEPGILGLSVESPKTVRATRDDCLGTRRQDPINVLLSEVFVDLVPDIFQYTTAADFFDQGVINIETVEKFEGRLGAFVFPIQPHTTRKIDILGLLVFLSAEIFRILLSIDIGVFVEYVVHALESRVAGTNMDHIFSHLLNDLGYIDA
jgi:hypothetical protein